MLYEARALVIRPILAAKHFCEYRLLYFRVCVDSDYRLLQLFPAVDKLLK